MTTERQRLPIALIFLLLASCAAYQIHPGAVNRDDSVAYDSLTIAQAIIEQARAEVTAGTLPEPLKAPLNILIANYNTAREAWLTYRASVRAGTPENAARLRASMEAMSAALNSFNRTRDIQ